MIDAELKSEKSRAFHRFVKNGLKLVNKLVTVPEHWLNDETIDLDGNARVLRKLLVDYSRYEDDRDPRKDMILNMMRFMVLLYHTDPFYRERIGWFLWEVHDAIERGEFGYETLFAIDAEGNPASCLVGYDPAQWFGAPAGRGWNSQEKQDFYHLTPEEVEQSAFLWEKMQRDAYNELVLKGLAKQKKINTSKG